MEQLVNWIQTLTFIGACFGYLRKYKNEQKANLEQQRLYLDLSVRVSEPKNGYSFALTSVDNRHSTVSKTIDNALILITPESDNPVECVKKIMQKNEYEHTISHTNDFELIKLTSPLYYDGIGIIPIHYYYSENVGVGNEMLTYNVPIDCSKLNSGIIYSVRFYIFDRERLHRSVQDSFFCNIQ